MAGENAQGPAQHHRLGLGADDEYLSEDGGQTLLRERVLALVHLLQVEVLPKGGEKSVVECSAADPDPDPDAFGPPGSGSISKRGTDRAPDPSIIKLKKEEKA